MRRSVLLISCLLFSIITFDPASAEDEKPVKKQVRFANLVVKGTLPETVGQLGLFGETQSNLRQTILRLERASKDDKIKGVILRVRSPMIGRGKLAELRDAITRTRAADKKVYAEIQMGRTSDYLLACACDEIVMPESGTLMITGVRAEVTFFKGLLDTLGVEADMLQVGDFKGAAEPFTRQSMSPEFRKQYEALLNDVYEQMVETIAADRDLDENKVRELIDTGLFTANDAKKAGLIDRVLYDDQFADALRDEFSVDELIVVKDYGKKKVDTNFSGMMGMIKFMELMMGVKPNKAISKNKKIALVYASGPIMAGTSKSTLFGGETLGSSTTIKALREAAKNDRVVAIVVRIDSPGGSALASDLIWREIVKIEKPVIASMGDTAASGGYYIAMGCDKIYAEPGTLTGSIGVVGGKMAVGGLYKKFGVTTDAISRGKNSGLLSMGTKFSDSEREVWMNSMKETYKQFVSKAAEGRGMSAEQLESLAGGRVWTGRQAKENGLVDELGTLRDALMGAKVKAGLKEEEKVELLLLPKPTSFLEQLVGGDSAELKLPGATGLLSRESRELLSEVEVVRRLFAEPSVLLMPYRMEIK